MNQGVLYVVALLCLKTFSANKTSSVDPTAVKLKPPINFYYPMPLVYHELDFLVQ
jgi:hypothetical protein